MIHVKTLDGQDTRYLYNIFTEAFRDYGRTWTFDEFVSGWRRRGCQPAFSYGAFDNDKLVSFTFNAIGQWNGRMTAYDNGTGTLEAYRGRGLAGLVFRESIPQLLANGVEAYLLEVLQSNEPAIKVYRRLGFEVTREFYYYMQPEQPLPAPSRMPGGIVFGQMPLPEPEIIEAMWDFRPSWQNSIESVRRSPDRFTIFGAWSGDELAGYAIIEPATGDIPQLAVAPYHRRRGIATALLAALRSHNMSGKTRIVNVDVSCRSMHAFLARQGIHPDGVQLEMLLDLKK